MIFHVTHRTHYSYANAAAFSQHLLRLEPRPAPGQGVLEARIDIDPAPDQIARETDMFGNLNHIATVTRPHRELTVTATSTIERTPPSELIFDASAPFETVRDSATVLGQVSAPETSVFAFPSTMTIPDASIEAYAAACFTPGRPVLAAARDLMHRIFEDFDYVPGVTFADTLPVDSFEAKRGVCQDFAHVMLAAIRSLRVPARYVSGYLRTIPPRGQERLQGADASHAWVAVWDPTFGWVDFDPTNDVVPGTDHVTVGWGRDFTDVSPVSGIVLGAGRQILSVGVDVVPATERV